MSVFSLLCGAAGNMNCSLGYAPEKCILFFHLKVLSPHGFHSIASCVTAWLLRASLLSLMSYKLLSCTFFWSHSRINQCTISNYLLPVKLYLSLRFPQVKRYNFTYPQWNLSKVWEWVRESYKKKNKNRENKTTKSSLNCLNFKHISIFLFLKGYI